MGLCRIPVIHGRLIDEFPQDYCRLVGISSAGVWILSLKKAPYICSGFFDYGRILYPVFPRNLVENRFRNICKPHVVNKGQNNMNIMFGLDETEGLDPMGEYL